jgi:hypothetical protein
MKCFPTLISCSNALVTAAASRSIDLYAKMLDTLMTLTPPNLDEVDDHLQALSSSSPTVRCRDRKRHRQDRRSHRRLPVPHYIIADSPHETVT